MGDKPGHEFHGNQYAAGRTEGVAEGRSMRASKVEAAVRDTLKAADQATRAGAFHLSDRLLGKAAGLRASLLVPEEFHGKDK